MIKEKVSPGAVKILMIRTKATTDAVKIHMIKKKTPLLQYKYT